MRLPPAPVHGADDPRNSADDGAGAPFVNACPESAPNPVLSPNANERLRRRPVVVRENPSDSFAPMNGPWRPLDWRMVDQRIPEPLVISLAVIVRDVLRKCSSQMPLA